MNWHFIPYWISITLNWIEISSLSINFPSYEEDPDNACINPEEGQPQAAAGGVPPVAAAGDAAAAAEAKDEPTTKKSKEKAAGSSKSSDYEDGLKFPTYMRRTNGASKHLGFSFLLDPLLNDIYHNTKGDSLRNNFFEGFQVDFAFFLHHTSFKCPGLGSFPIRVCWGDYR